MKRFCIKHLTPLILLINSAQPLYAAVGNFEIIVESPPANQDNFLCTGITTIHGYAGANIDHVTIIIDGQQLTNLPVGASRMDVQPDDINGFGPGWGTVFNCGILNDGRHTLKVTDQKGGNLKSIRFDTKKLGGDEFVVVTDPHGFNNIGVKFNNTPLNIDLLWSVPNQNFLITSVNGNGDTNNNGDNNNDDDTNTNREGLNAVNVLRSSGTFCGTEWNPPVPLLTWNDQLSKAADRHARDLADNIPDSNFGHTGSDGSTAGERIREAGYQWRTFGENANRATPNLKVAVESFRNSAGHCKNMMNKNFKDFGDSLASNPNSKWKDYVVQAFGTR